MSPRVSTSSDRRRCTWRLNRVIRSRSESAVATWVSTISSSYTLTSKSISSKDATLSRDSKTSSRSRRSVLIRADMQMSRSQSTNSKELALRDGEGNNRLWEWRNLPNLEEKRWDLQLAGNLSTRQSAPRLHWMDWNLRARESRITNEKWRNEWTYVYYVDCVINQSS